jgi:hypothetical protein
MLKIGWEENLKPTIGMFSLHKQSKDNGTGLINYIASVGMITGSTIFPHKQIYKFTWRSPDGNTTQIDLVLTDAQYCSNWKDI